jgi:hypothetical protein
MPLMFLIPLALFAFVFPRMFKFTIVVPLFGILFGFVAWMISLAFIDQNAQLFGIYIVGSLQGLLIWIMGGVTAMTIIGIFTGKD